MTDVPEKIQLARVSKGKRPVVFDDPNIDHLVTMVLELAAELSGVYQRLDTVERLLEDSKVLDRAKIDTYEASDAVVAERTDWRELLLERMFRTIRQDRG